MKKGGKRRKDEGCGESEKQKPLKVPSKREASKKKSNSSKEHKTWEKEQLLKPPFDLYESSSPSFKEGFSSVVNLLKGKKNIAVLTGAGISVSCGIPDFRSKGSGLYSTLDTEELGLSCPEELFDWEVFQENPRPFFKFARNLYFPLGGDKRVRPSDSHKLIALLEQKKMLLRVYTQNIDGLEQEAGVSTKKVVYAHGSLKWASCVTCKRKVSAKEIEPAICKRVVPRCQEPVGKGRRNSSSSSVGSSPSPSPIQSRSRKRPRSSFDDNSQTVCGGVLKPGVTFFGEALNDNVGRSLEADRHKVDALIVMGTSLSVAPMSKVIGYMPANIPRILINRTIVDASTKEYNDENDNDIKDWRNGYVFDAYLLGYCDDVTRALAKQLFVPKSATKEDVASHEEEDDDNEETCAVLSDVAKEKTVFRDEDWSFCELPRERVFLFPGAEPTGYESEIKYQEIAHCDGCAKRIAGTIQKCVNCFDYDLCSTCFPVLSKTHYNGEHLFSAEPAG